MLTEKNIRGLVVRLLLCSFGLLLGFSILTSKANLQSNPTPVKPPTPRPAVKNAANKTANAVRNTTSAESDTMPAPTPTPPANSTVRGRVFYADTGRAVKRASIMLMDGSGEGGPSSSPSALTDGEGYFQMKNVRAGTYYALVNAPGVVSPLAFVDFSRMSDRSREKESLEKAFLGFEQIVVDGITPIDIQVSARRGGAIGGRIMYDDGDVAIGVKVEILRKVDDKFIAVIPNLSTMFSVQTSGIFQTDDRGVYRFSGLPAGEYIVKVTENAAHGDVGTRPYYDAFDMFSGGTSFLTLFYPDAFDTKSAQLINVAAGQEISEINLMIPSRNLYKIEGKTIAAKDKSPVKARITITREGIEDTFSLFSETSRRQQMTLTDENGNWKFKELPKGAYKIVVEPIESESTYQNYLGNYSYGNSNSNADRNVPPKPKLAKKALVMPVEDKDISEIVVELGYGATVTGTVMVENSREMPKMVSVQALSETDKLVVMDNIDNSYNEYRPRKEKIEYDFKLENVIAGKNLLFVHSGEEDFYVKSATVGGVDLLAGAFEVKEGEILRNVQIVLGNDVGILKGTITDDQKQPVAGMTYTLVPVEAARRKSGNFFRDIKSDKEGKFETKLAPGAYAIVVFDSQVVSKSPEEYLKWLDAAVKDAQKVEIEAGMTETVKIVKK